MPLAFLCALLIGLAVGPGSGQAQTLNLPDVNGRIGVGVPFLRCVAETWTQVNGARTCPSSQAHTTLSSLENKVDMGFMWTYGIDSPSQLGAHMNLGAALKIDRFPGYAINNPRFPQNEPLSLSDWQHQHPTWIEYSCQTNSAGVHTTPAWEFGQAPSSATSTDAAYVPFNIDDPDARQYFFDHYIKLSLDAGYRLVLFDNISMRRNNWDRCGHYDSAGVWHEDYLSNNRYDPKYQADMLSWIQWLSNAIHAYAPDALFGINYTPVLSGDPPALWHQVYSAADVIWDEAGFTNWGAGDISGQTWLQDFQALSYQSSQPNKAVLINGIAGGHTNTDPNAITGAERQWVLANYLLVKGPHTYATLTPNSYGPFYPYPEYRLPIGSPEGAAYQSGAVWVRNFSGGAAVVNPTGSAQTIQVPAGAVDAEDRPLSGPMTLNPVSAVVILSHAFQRASGFSIGSTAADARGAPRLSSVSLTGVSKRRPRLAFTLTVPKGGSALRSISLRALMPLRLAFRPRYLVLPGAKGKRGKRPPTADVVITTPDGKRRIKFGARVVKGVMVLSLASATRTLRVVVSSPQLDNTRQLATQVRRRRAKTMSLGWVATTNTARNFALLRVRLKPR